MKLSATRPDPVEGGLTPLTDEQLEQVSGGKMKAQIDVVELEPNPPHPAPTIPPE
jgi:bacteriocin-like protein